MECCPVLATACSEQPEELQPHLVQFEEVLDTDHVHGKILGQVEALFSARTILILDILDIQILVRLVSFPAAPKGHGACCP